MNEFANALSGTIVSKCEQTKKEKATSSLSDAENSVITVVKESVSVGRYENTCGLHNYSNINKHSQITKSMQNTSESKFSKNYLRAIYEEDRHLQK